MYISGNKTTDPKLFTIYQAVTSFDVERDKYVSETEEKHVLNKSKQNIEKSDERDWLLN